MKYMMLLFEKDEAFQSMTEAEQGAIFAAHGAFTEAARKAGVFVGGEALEPGKTATTLSRREGKLVQTDGPFAETKEQLGGFYILECKNHDEAVAWAQKIPEIDRGYVEVRPLMDLEG